MQGTFEIFPMAGASVVRSTWPPLIDDRGRWKDVSLATYPGVPDSDRYLLFQTTEGLMHQLGRVPPPYDKEAMDRDFGGLKHLDRGSSFDNEE